MTARLFWMVFAPFEFLITVLVGVLLYVPWALFIYVRTLRGLFERAFALFVLRFRVGRDSSSLGEREAAPSLPADSARGPVERENSSSWLN